MDSYWYKSAKLYIESYYVKNCWDIRVLIHPQEWHISTLDYKLLKEILKLRKLQEYNCQRILCTKLFSFYWQWKRLEKLLRHKQLCPKNNCVYKSFFCQYNYERKGNENYMKEASIDINTMSYGCEHILLGVSLFLEFRWRIVAQRFM